MHIRVKWIRHQSFGIASDRTLSKQARSEASSKRWRMWLNWSSHCGISCGRSVSRLTVQQISFAIMRPCIRTHHCLKVCWQKSTTRSRIIVVERRWRLKQFESQKKVRLKQTPAISSRKYYHNLGAMNYWTGSQAVLNFKEIGIVLLTPMKISSQMRQNLLKRFLRKSWLVVLAPSMAYSSRSVVRHFWLLHGSWSKYSGHCDTDYCFTFFGFVTDCFAASYSSWQKAITQSGLAKMWDFTWLPEETCHNDERYYLVVSRKAMLNMLAGEVRNIQG